MQGEVKFFNSEKGFGFIQQDNGNDLFFHISNVQNQEELDKGDRVSYEEGSGDRGPVAIDVQKL